MLRTTSRRWLATGVATLAVVATSLTAVPASATAPGCTNGYIANPADPTNQAYWVPVRTCTGTSPNGNGAWVLEEPYTYDHAEVPTLLLWSHGFRASYDTNHAADNYPTSSIPQYNPVTHYALLAQGYALAGSAYGRNGWAVNDGVRADVELLRTILPANLATQPTHTYAWGYSLGGLITEMLAERYSGLVDAAAPMCGVMAGSVPLADHFLDVEIAAKTFFYPKLRLSGFTSDAQAQGAFENVQNAIAAKLADPTTQGATLARLVGLDVLLGLPLKTFYFNDKRSTSSLTYAALESFLTQVGYGLRGDRDVVARTGGNVVTNIGVNYTKYATTAAKNRFASYGFASSLLSAYAQTMQTYGARVAPSSTARANFAKMGMPTGNLKVPTLAMHTVYDPVVIVQNERVFKSRVVALGKTSLLNQVYIKPPVTGTDPSKPWGMDSPDSPPNVAYYGAGHCNFSPAHLVATVKALDAWVAGAPMTPAFFSNPVLQGVVAQMPGLPGDNLASSVGITYTPPAWPRPGVH